MESVFFLTYKKLFNALFLINSLLRNLYKACKNWSMLYTYMYSKYEFHHCHHLSDVDAVYIIYICWSENILEWLNLMPPW